METEEEYQNRLDAQRAIELRSEALDYSVKFACAIIQSESGDGIFNAETIIGTAKQFEVYLKGE